MKPLKAQQYGWSSWAKGLQALATAGHASQGSWMNSSQMYSSATYVSAGSGVTMPWMHPIFSCPWCGELKDMDEEQMKEHFLKHAEEEGPRGTIPELWKALNNQVQGFVGVDTSPQQVQTELMTAQEIDTLATLVAQKVAKLLDPKAFVPTLPPCAWKMLMPYEKSCHTSGQRHVKVASLVEGTPMESDWKEMWLCDEHFNLISQHNAYEIEET